MSDTERRSKRQGRLCEHATPGPWTASSTGIKAHDGAHTVVYAPMASDVESSDAAFIARARTLSLTDRDRAPEPSASGRTRRRFANLGRARTPGRRQRKASGQDRDEYAAANLAANAIVSWSRKRTGCMALRTCDARKERDTDRRLRTPPRTSLDQQAPDSGAGA